MGELVLPRGHWDWQMAFWNPPSILLMLEPGLPTSLSAPVLGCLRTSKQLGRDTAPLTSRPAALRHPEPTTGSRTHPHIPVHWHELWDQPHHEWLGISPRTPRALALTTSRLKHPLQDPQGLEARDPETWLHPPVSQH